MTGFKFEHALRLLVSAYPREDQKKPALYHSIRVGSWLWQKGYSEDIQIAGLLHDALEDTTMSYEDIEQHFGSHVAEIVLANSKNTLLPKSEILEDIVRRCADYGEEALLVKLADVYDNFLFYTQQGNQAELERCKVLFSLISKYTRPEFTDPAFSLAQKYQC